MKIAISSGKGGTGKTFISTNIARTLEKTGEKVRYLDCDVEAPNGHLFLKPEIHQEEVVRLLSPVGVDAEKCIACGKCVEACKYGARALINKRILFFQNMCHICGACTIVCPVNAIVEDHREIGRIIFGHCGQIDMVYALLKTGEAGMSPRLIQKVKKLVGNGLNIFDSPPGTGCPVVETVRDADICVLVTDPTPFSIHDLKLSVDMCRKLNQEPMIVVNRATYLNDDLQTYCREASIEIIGEIPDDRKIAECYAVGDLVVDVLPQYQSVFKNLAEKILDRAGHPKPVTEISPALLQEKQCRFSENPVLQKNTKSPKTRELVIISGKGGTGKTTLAACFCALNPNMAIADCDVDAADLHLILQPDIKEKGLFSGGDIATIDTEKCTGCGDCKRHCRFFAIHTTNQNSKPVCQIDALSCEGCGVCGLVCLKDAVRLEPAVNGMWFLSETRFGPMSHAALGVAEENSGKLVTLVRKNKDMIAANHGLENALIDGSPGTGCPVVASITAAEYALVVTEPTVSGVHDLNRILEVIQFFNIPSGVVVNKSDLNWEKTEEIKKIAEKNNSDFLGMIPFDSRVNEAQVMGLSVVEYTADATSRAIQNIWKKLLNTHKFIEV